MLKNNMNTAKIIFFICGLTAILFAVVPVFYRVINAGSMALFIAGAALLTLALLWHKIHPHTNIRNIILLLIAIVAAVCIACSISIANKAWFNRPQESGKQTVIVLGSHVYEHGPSLMLKYRLDEAIDYMNLNPQSVCIVTGGQGVNEPYSEAYGMYNYMVSMRVDPQRISQEDTSTNTEENLKFAMQYIAPDSDGIIIVSNDFHLKRACILAEAIGIKPATIPAKTPYGLIPVYWAREIGGVLLTGIKTMFN